MLLLDARVMGRRTKRPKKTKSCFKNKKSFFVKNFRENKYCKSEIKISKRQRSNDSFGRLKRLVFSHDCGGAQWLLFTSLSQTFNSGTSCVFREYSLQEI